MGLGSWHVGPSNPFLGSRTTPGTLESAHLCPQPVLSFLCLLLPVLCDSPTPSPCHSIWPLVAPFPALTLCSTGYLCFCLRALAVLFSHLESSSSRHPPSSLHSNVKFSVNVSWPSLLKWHPPPPPIPLELFICLHSTYYNQHSLRFACVAISPRLKSKLLSAGTLAGQAPVRACLAPSDPAGRDSAAEALWVLSCPLQAPPRGWVPLWGHQGCRPPPPLCL